MNCGSGLRGCARCHTVFVLAAVMLIGICVHLTTVDISPVHWIDEIQIAEIAHGGVSSKSVNSNLCLMRTDGALDTQSWALYWLGGWFHNAAYDVMGRVGPRVLQLAWLAGLTLVVFFYVRKRAGSGLLSFFLSMAVFALPQLCKSVRGGRVDAQSLFFGMLSLLLLACSEKRTSQRRSVMCLAAGGAFALSVFSWITALMLAPLLLNEVFQIQRTEDDVDIALCKDTISVGLGALVVAIIMLLPFLLNIHDTITTFNSVVAMNAPHGSFHFAWKEFAVNFINIPFLVLGIVALFFTVRKYCIALIGFLLFAIVCVMTRVYVFRMIYFVPYAIVGFIGVYRAMKRQCAKSYCCAGLGILAIISFVWSVGVRNFTEFFARSVRDYDYCRQVLSEKVGVGPRVRVYLDACELGYLARELEWRAVRSANGCPSRDVLASCSYVIGKERQMSCETIKAFGEAGFVLTDRITGNAEHEMGTMESFLAKLNRLSPLGPYLIYSRE